MLSLSTFHIPNISRNVMLENERSNGRVGVSCFSINSDSSLTLYALVSILDYFLDYL